MTVKSQTFTCPNIPNNPEAQNAIDEFVIALAHFAFAHALRKASGEARLATEGPHDRANVTTAKDEPVGAPSRETKAAD